MHPYYLTLNKWEHCDQDIKLICPACKHTNYRHIHYTEHTGKKAIVKCWFCARVTWVIHIIADNPHKPGNFGG